MTDSPDDRAGHKPRTNAATHAMRPRKKLTVSAEGPDNLLRNARRFRTTVVAYLYDFKSDRIIVCASTLERDFCLAALVSKSVASVERNGDYLTYRTGAEIGRHFPDFALKMRNGAKVYVEVKSEHWLKRPKTLRKFQAVDIRAQEMGLRYLILTERNLRHRHRCRNIEEIHAFGSHSAIVEEVVEAVKARFPRTGACSIGAMVGELNSAPPETRAAFMHLTAWGDLVTNLDAPITAATSFRRAS